MITRSSIAAVCIAVFASCGIAMQDFASKPTAPQSNTNNDEPPAVGNPSSNQNARYELALTDELVRLLKLERQLISHIPDEVVGTISSILIRHEHGPKNGKSLAPSVNIGHNGAITIHLDNEELNRLRSESMLLNFDVADLKTSGPIKSVKLTYENTTKRWAVANQQGENFRFPETPLRRTLSSRNAFPLNNAIDQKTLEFNAEVRRLSRELKAKESDAEKSDLQDEIRELLESEYDRHLGKQQTKLAEMELRLDKLRQQFNKQKESKEKLVEMRMTSIVSDAEGISWPADRSQNFFSRSNPPFNSNRRSGTNNIRQNSQISPFEQLDRRLEFERNSNEPVRNTGNPNPRTDFTRPARSPFERESNQRWVQERAAEKRAAELRGEYLQQLQLKGETHRDAEKLYRSSPSPAKSPITEKPTTETYATGQTKFWLLGMAELAKTGNWDGLQKLGRIIVTAKNPEGEKVEIIHKKNKELLAGLLESAARQNKYFHTNNRCRWEIELDEKMFTLHILTTSERYPAIGSILMLTKPGSELMNRLPELDSRVKLEFDKEGLLILKGSDADSVKKTEKVIRKLLEQKKDFRP